MAMAACITMQLLHTSQLPCSSHITPGRSCCVSVRRKKARQCGLLSSFWCRRSGSSWNCSHGKLAYACNKSLTVWVMVMENLSGRVDTPVDLGIKVSNLEFLPDILDIRYREDNRTSPPAIPHNPPSDGYGPSELDFEIYASNSMEGYEPPPPPPIPFGFPFEDYYDEAIGVDFISKEDKPASSLLQFVDSLNSKKAEEDGNNLNRPLFGQSPLKPAKIAGDEPGFCQATSEDDGEGGLDTDSDEHANIRFDACLPEAEASLEPISFSSNLTAEKSFEDPPNSLHMSSHEQIFAEPLNDPTNTTREFQHASSATVPTQVVTDSGKPSLFQAGITEQPRERRMLFVSQNEASEEFEARGVSSSTSSGVADYTSVEDAVLYSRASSLSGKNGNASTDPLIGRSQNIEDELAEQSEENSGQVLVQHGFASQAVKSYTEVTQYYEPREGDIILGAVTFINDQKVDLEIGAELAALMPLRELQPFSQNVEKMLFEPPSSEDAFDVPHGASLLVKDTAAFGAFTSNRAVDIGTVVLAEVTGRTIIDGRAILSCKSPAQRIAWHRLEQLMRLGEAVQLEILQWNEGGLLGCFEGVRAFLPRSELLQRPESTSVLKTYVGKKLSVSILQVDRQKLNMIASEARAWMSKNLQLGTVHDVTVTRVHSYGMQVEVNNTKIRGFVHKTNFSNEYVSSASNYFAEGDMARVMLIKGRNPEQISFGLADLERDSGLLLRDKEQVFQDAKEMGRRFREHLSMEERQVFGVAANDTSLDYQCPKIANLAWLHL